MTHFAYKCHYIIVYKHINIYKGIYLNIIIQNMTLQYTMKGGLYKK